jgi:nicotinamidase-related amidase
MTSQTLSNAAPLIVIDLQTGMFDGVFEPPIHDAEHVLQRAQKLIDWARRTERKIAFIQHEGPEGDPLARGAPGWPVFPALGRADNEPTFGKKVGDAFSNPEFGSWLQRLAADEVILLGAQTDHCVAATLAGAMKAGLRVTVVSDAHSTLDFGGEAARNIIDRHNAAFAEAGARIITTRTLIGD